MEKDDKNQGTLSMGPPPETEFFLQWGKRKRLRCMRIRSSSSLPNIQPHFSSSPSDPPSTTTICRKISSTLLSVSHQEKQFPFSQPPSRLTRNFETTATLRSENNRRGSPEKEERWSYTTRGSVSVLGNLDESRKVDARAALEGNQGGDENVNTNNNITNGRGGGGRGGIVWPKLYITLSSKEKEEDFMAMKGCKLPQRPKKRAKVVQRTLLLVSPGAWLSDMSLERYEVREKKTSKKRPRGLKAMGSVDSDSD